MDGFNLEVERLRRKNLALTSKIYSLQKSLSNRKNDCHYYKKEIRKLNKYFMSEFKDKIKFMNEINILLQENYNLTQIIKTFNKETGSFDSKDKEKAEMILSQVQFNIDILLSEKKIKSSKLRTIKSLQKELGHVETLFYYNNFKLGIEEISVLKEINSTLRNFYDFYRGIKEIPNVTIREINLFKSAITKLKFIIQYKEFEKYVIKIAEVETIFNEMKKTQCIKEDYNLEEFKKEIISLITRNKYFFNTLFVERIFEGDIFGRLPKFLSLNYNYNLINTYGRYRHLYIFGNKEQNIYKVGITFNSILSRFLKAKESFNRHYADANFEEIFIIDSLNAYKLELYIKNKFKNKQHKLFNSKEWFSFNENEIDYFLNEEYLLDNQFMEIYEFKLI